MADDDGHWDSMMFDQEHECQMLNDESSYHIESYHKFFMILALATDDDYDSTLTLTIYSFQFVICIL